ncbi:MAG: NUDIX hydrolase N-terminal domain-containing protein [Candidatus Thorarchaeota archaeon]
MVCQICGKKSGYYPLCAEHFQMRDQGLVIKCKECGKWHLKAEGCSQCKHEERDSGEIMFERGLLERWGKKLFRIFKLGEKHGAKVYDLDRYDGVRRISGELHELWKDMDKKVVYIPQKLLEEWYVELDGIAQEGLHYSDDSYDIERYSDILGIAEEIHEQVQSYSMDLDEIPEQESASSDVSFVKDREILPKLLSMIDKAEKTILIASPWIKGITEIEDELAQVKERNVSIRILTRREGDDLYHGETIRGFHKRGFVIEIANHLHAKIVLIDNKELYIGSANLSGTSMKRNLEAGICTTDPRTVSQARVYFDEVFTEAFESRFSDER